MTNCASCGMNLDWYDISYPYPTDMRKRECLTCHISSMENGELTQCDECGAYFPGSRLKMNNETGGRELCPCCGQVWCH
jgi:hypothetical protein